MVYICILNLGNTMIFYDANFTLKLNKNLISGLDVPSSFPEMENIININQKKSFVQMKFEESFACDKCLNVTYNNNSNIDSAIHFG